MRYLSILILLCLPSAALSQDCVSSPEDFWVCKGESAWATGYLLPPDILDLREVQLWEEKAALVPELTEQRDEFQRQRDSALKEIDRWETDYNTLREHSLDLQSELGSSYSGLETLGLSLAVGGIGVVAGLLVGAFAL